MHDNNMEIVMNNVLALQNLVAAEEESAAGGLSSLASVNCCNTTPTKPPTK